MDQYVIQAVKMQYEKALLFKVLSKEDSVIQAIKIIALWHYQSNKKRKDSKTNDPQNEEQEVSLATDEPEENVDRELTEHRDTIAKIHVDESESLTTDDVNMWPAGEKE